MSRLPVITIVGRPNVGKSTLFNALTRSRDALVADMPGVTRDRIYGRAELGEESVVVIDTGGLTPDLDPDPVAALSARQVQQALDEADGVLFVTDARDGLNAHDQEIGSKLRRLGKPVVVAVNKTDGLDAAQAVADASELGLGDILAVSAEHRRGLEALSGALLENLPRAESDETEDDDFDGIRLALVGRPNTGKSTLLNRLVGEERSLAVDLPGTTRDPVKADIQRDGHAYRLVDTAGIRRRSRVHEAVEKFSVIKALQAIEKADFVVLLLDGREGVTDQDAGLAGHILEAGRPLVIAVNKWDGLDDYHRKQVREQLHKRLGFADFTRVVTISALHGTGLGELFDAIEEAWESARRELTTSALSRCLEQAVEAHPPPSSQRFAPKLRFAHSGGIQPTRIVIHGNRTRHVPETYRRYLVNRFRKAFNLRGIPIRLIFRDSENPYAGKRNTLNKRQLEKRKRLRKHVRSK